MYKSLVRNDSDELKALRFLMLNSSHLASLRKDVLFAPFVILFRNFNCEPSLSFLGCSYSITPKKIKLSPMPLPE